MLRKLTGALCLVAAGAAADTFHAKIPNNATLTNRAGPGLQVVPTYPRATPQNGAGFGLQAKTVLNDRGGLLIERLLEVRELRRNQRPVRVMGRVCYSTCTLFLGLQNTCVSPDTVFGFHGPSSYGTPLEPATFERASVIIASHYPGPLKNWYMEKGRKKLDGLYFISGANIIDMGVPSCEGPPRG